MGTNKHLQAEKQVDKNVESKKHTRYQPAKSLDEILALSYPALYLALQHVKQDSLIDVNK